MSSFDSIAKSSKYLKSYNDVIINKPSGVLYIEDSLDRTFWEALVEMVCPDRYRVMPYSQPGSEGKRSLEKQYAILHPDLIVGVDGDYDFLCPDRNEYASHLINNPFVIHTFYYSRESHFNTKEAIDYYLNSIYLYIKINNQLHEALLAYSNHIFKALCIFAWFHNKDRQGHPENTFNKIIELPNGVKLLDRDLNINATAIASIQQKVSEYIVEFEPCIGDKESFEKHIESLYQKGINPETAYLFTEGHYLQDGILIPLLKMVIKGNQDIDKEWAETNYPEKCIDDRRRNVLNHYKDNCSSSTLIFNSTAHHAGHFWKKIIGKLEAVTSMK